jgi:hypothetical protein
MDIAIRQEAGPCRSVANATQSNKVTGCRGRETWGFLDWPHTFSKGISRVAALGLGVALASAAGVTTVGTWSSLRARAMFSARPALANRP